MSIPADIQKAVDLIESKGAGAMTARPPLHRMLWKKGVKLPPPVMAGVGSNMLLVGAFCTLVFMFNLQALAFEMPLKFFFLGMSAGGLLTGLVVACILESKRKKLGLPLWRDFKHA